MLAPFYYGVVSGDPLSDRVIIWTHLTTSEPGSVAVEWQMATDTLFYQLVASGTAYTDASKGYTVKVDVNGLQPDTWYYYRFIYQNKASIIGRTRTMPAATKNQLRFAVMTCADFKDGYFNAYERVAQRNDLDAIIHLGDYIYESKSDHQNLRQVLPPVKCATLNDYRTRYAYYRLDPQLMMAHQQYPWFCIWDDHEFRNDAWRDGASSLSGQDWIEVRNAALQAYHEWMPVRPPDSSNLLRIYRHISLGPLADLILLDARIIGRDEPLPLNDSHLNDPQRTALGNTQRNWFFNTLSASIARWKLVAQQILMAPYYFAGNPFPGTEKVWNGFPAERQLILDYLFNNAIDNVVVLTGDVHAAFANDLPRIYTQYDSLTGAGTVAVEYVTPSVTSGGSTALPLSFIRSHNPYVVFADLVSRGYMVLDITADTVCGNFYFTPWEQYSTNETFAGNYCSTHARPHLRLIQQESIRKNPMPSLAPEFPLPLSARKKQIPVKNALRAYPNPAKNMLYVDVMLARPSASVHRLMLYNVWGDALYTSWLEEGYHQLNIDLSALIPGIYVLYLHSEEGSHKVKIVKH